LAFINDRRILSPKKHIPEIIRNKRIELVTKAELGKSKNPKANKYSEINPASKNTAKS
jgi:hypothetical protein